MNYKEPFVSLIGFTPNSKVIKHEFHIKKIHKTFSTGRKITVDRCKAIIPGSVAALYPSPAAGTAQGQRGLLVSALS